MKKPFSPLIDLRIFFLVFALVDWVTGDTKAAVGNLITACVLIVIIAAIRWYERRSAPATLVCTEHTWKAKLTCTTCGKEAQ